MKKSKLLVFVTVLALLSLAVFSAFAEWTDEDYASVAKAIQTGFAGKTVILHSNDVHGALGGYAYMSQMKTSLENAGAEVIMVDAGDFSQGSIYVSSTKGAAAIDMMNKAGYDVVTLGNHEFDFGYAQLMENLKDAKFNVICSNVYLDETGESILPACVVCELENGLKIGFFGMETPETATKVNPGLIKEISFSTFDDLYKAAQESVDALKAEGVDLVIGLCHLGVDAESAPNGYRSIDLFHKVEGIDFIIDGHSHTVMTAGQDGEPIQSTGTQFAYLGLVVIDNETKTIEDNFLLGTSGLVKDPTVEAAAKEIMDKIDAEYTSVFAKTDILLNGERDPGNRTEETNLGDLITDAMVWSVLKEGGVAEDEYNHVVGITNGGGIRATIQAGDITKKDINTVLPFGNTVALIYVTGNELLEALEASTFSTPEAIGGFPQTSGIKWSIDTTKAYDQGDVYTLNGKESSYYAPKSISRVTIESVNGEPFDPEAVYAVVSNNFCAAGGDTYNAFFRAYEEGSGFDTGIPMDEAVISYIQDVLGGTITAEMYGEPAGRLTIVK